MKIVIDFSGYTINDIYTIKEFCKSYIHKKFVDVHIPVVTKPLIRSKFRFRRLINKYKKCYAKTGIKWSSGTTRIGHLRARIIETLKRNKKAIIYVRNEKKRKLLLKFMKKRFNVKCLSDLGFEGPKKMETICRFHDNPQNNYCARTNALVMGDWLYRFINKDNKMIVDNNNHMIIDFSGYSNNENNEFMIKELSLVCINGEGRIIYQEFLVKKESNEFDQVPEGIRNNYNNFYERYGIKWGDGFFEGGIEVELKKILWSGVGFVWVKNREVKNKFIEIVGEIFEVMCLDDYGFIEQERERACLCGYHTHEEENNNFCVDENIEDMVDWVLGRGLFRSEVRSELQMINPLDIGMDIDVDDFGFDLENIEPYVFTEEELNDL
ncbi:putative Bracovirus protein MdBV-1-26 [Microplitis demolitor]